MKKKKVRITKPIKAHLECGIVGRIKLLRCDICGDDERFSSRTIETGLEDGLWIKKTAQLNTTYIPSWNI